MAYNNNREWDYGKDSWGGGPSRVRGREEDYNTGGDYNGEGKRRKFNAGGYDGNYGSYDQGPSDAAYAGGYDVGTGANQHGGPGAPPKKRMQASEPSPHVIFLGLDPDFTESDLQAYLVSQHCSVETVTIIRERSSGTSKGFGFAQFASTEHARAFVDPLFPFIQVPPPASHGATSAAAFYKALESGAPHNGRRVKIDYSQSVSPQEKGRQRGNQNDGTRDIGNSQGPVLLFRGLDPLSGPQAIHQAMRGSMGPSVEGGKGMRRIIQIKDKVTLASFGFAFVEFVDVQSAATVLAATMSQQLHPNGFRISDVPVAASFAQAESFQPVDPMMRDEASIMSSSSLGGGEGFFVRYWDETSSVAVLEFKVATPVHSSAASKEKEKKKKAKDASIRAAAPEPSLLPISSKPVTLNFKAKTAPVAGAVKPPGLAFGTDDADEDDDPVDLVKAAATRKVAPLVASKKIANNINKWNQVQEELSHKLDTPEVSAPILAGPARETEPTVVEPMDVPVSTVTDEFEYSDMKGLSCLLCARQFKTLDQLKRHNKESDLHKARAKLLQCCFNDEKLCDIARRKVQAKRGAPSQEAPKYRDRASERRVLFNQPDAPLPEKGDSQHRKVDVPPRAPSPAPFVPPAKDENNVGNKLLKMMGWKEGTGLGTDGDGIVDPIKTALYAEGAGLGASKGQDIDHIAMEGQTGYLAKAQHSARERYGSS